MREELSEIIAFEMGDPRIGPVDITEVLVTPDMRHSRVRLHLGGDDGSRDQTLQALEAARHFLRRELASRLRLYRMPDLHFEADLETHSQERLEHLLKRARKGRPRNSAETQKSTLE
jgi:ribosome-binding factor A